MDRFVLHSDFEPMGDQPQAIEALTKGFEEGNQFETLVGVTGSGKTFTMANIIQNVQKPTLIISHNKTLAAQLYGEMKEFFPENAVEYFVSYYDYYQPEAYVPQSDTYIAKDSSINDEIDKLRHSATAALSERNDVIIVASVSCIYGLGAPVDYKNMVISLRPGMEKDRDDMIRKLIDIQYVRNDQDFKRGTFRVRGDVVEVYPSSSSGDAIRVEFFGDEVDRISEIDSLTGKVKGVLEHIAIFPNSHYVVEKEKMDAAIENIKAELAERVKYFKSEDKLLEAQRIEERTNFDIEMMQETGFCSGIENYSRHLAGLPAGCPPYTLMDYFPDDFLIIVDESHITIPQIRGMYAGDQSRKTTLVDYGFRLPSAKDNRPLNFSEFESKISQMLFVSATPSTYEAEHELMRTEQVIRPTGLLDPEITVKPIEGQIDDLISEINKETAKKNKVLVTTLTKRMAEDLTDYLKEAGIRVKYLHADIDTLERQKIIRDMRLDGFDVLVGINLLREGLDIPEISLVAILDADKEGFLRTETSLIQTIGRAARNAEGYVIMYADKITESMEKAISETERRRKIQQEYNDAHGITPQTIKKAVRDLISISKAAEPGDASGKLKVDYESMSIKELEKVKTQIEKNMRKAAAELNFEEAAQLRDKMIEINKYIYEGKNMADSKLKKEIERGSYKNCIRIKGAREHNLKGIDVDIPRGKLVVLTGLSGSGKSSLAFDTIYAEGQRRYMESLSSYARQFLGQMEKPDVDSIEGLSPAISIDQKSTNRNPRSTVGTVTEIYDYFRLLYARIGIPHCPKCGREINKQTVDQMVDVIMALPERTKIQILAPVVRGRKGEHVKLFEQAKKSGFVRVIADGSMYELTDEIKLDKNKKHNIEIVVDRLSVRDGIQKRLTDSIETALKLAEGLMTVDVIDGEPLNFSQSFSCPDCGISIDEVEPRSFSFNNPFGACPDCFGLGYTMKFDAELLIPDESLSIDEGAIVGMGWQSSKDEGSFTRAVLDALAEEYGFSLKTPFKDYPDDVKDIIINGTKGHSVKVKYKGQRGEGIYDVAFEGLIKNMERRYRETYSDTTKQQYEEFMRIRPCSACHGQRLKPSSLAVTIADKNIYEITNMSIIKLQEFLENMKLSERQLFIGAEILKEIKARIKFLVDVGLDYLALSRATGTLSGGEAQRIRLATQIGSGLVGVAYILDEPSIGLHQRDNDKLLGTLTHLRDLGNSVIVVEHDEDTMFAADYIVDIGPGAGRNGGEVVATGTAADIMACKDSLTGAYLSGRIKIPVPAERRKPTGWIKVRGARENNLKNIDVDIPLGVVTCVTGVSGSGKSSLVNEILYKHLAKSLNRARCIAGDHDGIDGIEQLDKVINIDQSPIGRTPRSNPATYTGVFDMIRDLFATTKDAKERGYTKGRFSFNVKGGRCEACSGDGIIKIEMHFLPDVYVPCEVCEGKRYNRETLEVKYKDKSIYDVLDMTIEDAVDFFENVPSIRRKIETLNEVGLSYVKLGQPSTELSGGEAQRIKLATELSRRSTGKTIYILDEPTTGLHFADVHKLVNILHRLAEGGNTVVVIEHNLDVIKTADYIIDMGPEGGDRGGTVIAKGTPEEIVKVKKSYTGQYVKKYLEEK